jgi:hypothetical protein
MAWYYGRGGGYFRVKEDNQNSPLEYEPAQAADAHERFRGS